MSAGLYRKRPCVIEAVQYGRRFDWPDWFADAVSDNRVIVHGTGKYSSNISLCYAEIKTLEGSMLANEGDWIIKGVAGELSPCKPDIFEATYEPLSPAPAPPEQVTAQTFGDGLRRKADHE